MIQKQNPCFMPGAKEYIESILNKDMVVFEWGSGASTQWFAYRVKFIYSVEHQRKWFDTTSGYMADCNNFRLIFKQICPIDDYVKSICSTMHNQFDVIIIDGRHRVECLREAIKHIKPNGFIIFDDIERIRYAEAKRILSTFHAKYFYGSLHKNCIFDDDPSGFTAQITGVYKYE